MKKQLLLVSTFLLALFTQTAMAQNQYKFKTECQADATEVKNQQNTGTCWSFATSSFLESELIRMGKGKHDLSEMFVVRNIYLDKARNYLLRQGKANFSQGSLAHDVIAAIDAHGVVPESAYSGKLAMDKVFDHSEMEVALKGFLDGLLKQKTLSNKWPMAFNGILDAYMGKAPESFKYEGKEYTPKSFASYIGFKASDYISITSFSHHPFYSTFVLEVPDNYSNGYFYNVPLNDMEMVLDKALKAGYTISWDTDVSEESFSAGRGLAVLPTSEDHDLFFRPGVELKVNQTNRQANFESYATTDDHLMHITGIVKDQNGNKYYIVKNSWGKISELKGYIYVSAAYFRMKSISIMLHKDAVPKEVAAKLNL